MAVVDQRRWTLARRGGQRDVWVGIVVDGAVGK